MVGHLAIFNTDEIENRLTNWGLNFWVIGKNFLDHTFHQAQCIIFHPVNLLPRSLEDL